MAHGWNHCVTHTDMWPQDDDGIVIQRFRGDTLQGNLLRCIVMSTDEEKMPQKRLKAGKMCCILSLYTGGVSFTEFDTSNQIQ